jgi:hypothetical protein
MSLRCVHESRSSLTHTFFQEKDFRPSRVIHFSLLFSKSTERQDAMPAPRSSGARKLIVAFIIILTILNGRKMKL